MILIDPSKCRLQFSISASLTAMRSRPSLATVLINVKLAGIVWIVDDGDNGGGISNGDRPCTSTYPVSPGWRWRRRRRRERILAALRGVRERRGASSRESARFRSGAARPWPGVDLSLLSEVSYILAATTAAAVAAFVSHASGAAGANRGAAA